MLSSFRKIIVLSLAVAASCAYSAESTLQTEFDKTEKFKDWTLGCIKNESGKMPCVLAQSVLDPKEKKIPLLKFTIGMFAPPDGSPAAIIAAPLGVALVAGIDINIDGKRFKIEGKELYGVNYERCHQNGCLAGFPMTDEIVTLLKAGKKINATIYWSPDKKSDKKAELPISLSGFTEAYAAFLKANK